MRLFSTLGFALQPQGLPCSRSPRPRIVIGREPTVLKPSKSARWRLIGKGALLSRHSGGLGRLARKVDYAVDNVVSSHNSLLLSIILEYMAHNEPKSIPFKTSCLIMYHKPRFLSRCWRRAICDNVIILSIYSY